MSELQKDSEDVFAGIGKKKYSISFPAIWGQSWRGQLWPCPVHLGLTLPECTFQRALLCTVHICRLQYCTPRYHRNVLVSEQGFVLLDSNIVLKCQFQNICLCGQAGEQNWEPWTNRDSCSLSKIFITRMLNTVRKEHSWD
jgi:hypothetical protein